MASLRSELFLANCRGSMRTPAQNQSLGKHLRLESLPHERGRPLDLSASLQRRRFATRCEANNPLPEHLRAG